MSKIPVARAPKITTRSFYLDDVDFDHPMRLAAMVRAAAQEVGLRVDLSPEGMSRQEKACAALLSALSLTPEQES